MEILCCIHVTMVTGLKKMYMRRRSRVQQQGNGFLLYPADAEVPIPELFHLTRGNVNSVLISTVQKLLQNGYINGCLVGLSLTNWDGSKKELFFIFVKHSRILPLYFKINSCPIHTIHRGSLFFPEPPVHLPKSEPLWFPVRFQKH